MRQSGDKTGGVWRHAAALSVLVLSLSSCCSTGSVDALDVAETPSQVRIAKDGYPDFSAPLKAAMSQMTDEEANQMSAELGALESGRRAGTIGEAEYWRRVRALQALAKTHSAETLAEIEGSQQ